jgi:hypothetical protein
MRDLVGCWITALKGWIFAALQLIIQRMSDLANWPEWWEWEIELSPHLLKRMIDRSFNEADLRQMLEDATAYHENHEEGRWVIVSNQAGRQWEIIVEPCPEETLLVVVTAYPVD